ncbi:hypothetical protein PENTCL1PPCAC_19399, partial [Pristionchus entomophagus]
QEKYSVTENWNLSCIVVLPCYQKQGFGRFLIDFSYLLTRREKKVGTPEQPFSNLGRVTYAAYWKSALLEYLRNVFKVENREQFSLYDIAVDTGISLNDAVKVLEALGMLVKDKDSDCIELLYNEELIEAHWKKAQANKERIWIDESVLKWEPAKHAPLEDGIVGSPSREVSPALS